MTVVAMRSIAGSCVVAVALVGILLSPATASAEIRTATAIDPPDATPTVSGIPDNPDISQVDVTYDSAGSLTITAHFYNPVNAVNTSEHFDFWSTFIVGEGSASSLYPGFCGPSSGAAGAVDGQHHVYSSVGTSIYNQADVRGYSGKLQFTRSESADRRSVTISATSPALANHNYTCLGYSLFASQRASVSNLKSEYSEACGCWYIPERLDYLGPEWCSGIWFNGFMPPPPPPPEPKKRKARVKAEAYGGCKRVILKRWRIKPGYQPAEGMIVARVGKKKRRFSTKRTKPVIFRIRPGYYNVVIKYLADRWRKPSKAERIFVIVGRGRKGRCIGRHSRRR